MQQLKAILEYSLVIAKRDDMMSTRAYLRKKYREMRSQHPELLDDAIRVTSKFHVIEEKVAHAPPNIEMVDLDEDDLEVLEQIILDDDMVLTTEH